MSTLHDLMADPDRTPNTISVITPSLPASEALATRLEALPDVSHTVTLRSFIPADQEEKLALIADAAMWVQVLPAGAVTIRKLGRATPPCCDHGSTGSAPVSP